MRFNIKDIKGECEFKPIDMRDGLRLSGYAAKMSTGTVDESAEAMVKIGDIALKYLYVDDEPIKDIAGLVSILEMKVKQLL